MTAVSPSDQPSTRQAARRLPLHGQTYLGKATSLDATATHLLYVLLRAKSSIVNEAIQPAMFLDGVSNALVDRGIVRHVQLLDMEATSCRASRSIVEPVDRSLSYTTLRVSCLTINGEEGLSRHLQTKIACVNQWLSIVVHDR